MSRWPSAALSQQDETRENSPVGFCQVFKYRGQSNPRTPAVMEENFLKLNVK